MGPITFRYPSAFEEVLIGARAVEIASAGRATPVALEALPLRARLMAEAIATLEYVIRTAPEGWYAKGADGKPVLAPGLIGEGMRTSSWRSTRPTCAGKRRFENVLLEPQNLARLKLWYRAASLMGGWTRGG
ncbi:hypothetical protein [Thermus antranikianii]|uniref:hypothetical protein n=1 Tax=Thermus antranikianii TaxID=88190 RepID=UPI001C7729C9|nr:hypothetical protein [Thermus antranikianii]QWK20783.1 MAG: hypothetical protein KNN15_06820 [Thermus antranikianii]